MTCQKHFYPKNVCLKFFLGQQQIWAEKVFGHRFLIKTNVGKILGPERFGSKEVGSKKNWIKRKFESKDFWVPQTYLKLGYSIRFKLGRILYGQKFTGQMFSRQLTIHTDCLIIEFG